MRVITLLAVMVLSTQALAETKSVIVAPFEETNELQQPDWISRSLHQSLVNDVASVPEVTVLNASKPADPDDAKYIVRSTIQRSNGELRITGRVEEVATGKTIGGFKAGGSERELFAIQDSIARQVRGILGGGDAMAAQQQPAQQQTRPQQAQQPVMMANGVFEGSDLQRALMDRDYVRRQSIRGSVPDYTYMTPTYPQPTYPYASGGYPYWYPYGGFGHFWGNFPGVIVIRKGHHHHHHGGKSHGGGFHHGGGGVQHVGGFRHGGNSQRLRSAAVFGHHFSGQANMVASPTSGQVRVGGGGHGGGR